MRTFNAVLAMLSLIALAFGNGIYIFTVTNCSGLGCFGHDAGAMLFLAGGIALGVLPWLFSLVRWLFSGPGGGVPGVLPFAPLLPVAVFLAIMSTPVKGYFENHFSIFVGAVTLSLLLTPVLTLAYNVNDHYWVAAA